MFVKDTNVCCFYKNENLSADTFCKKLLPRLRKLGLLGVMRLLATRRYVTFKCPPFYFNFSITTCFVLNNLSSFWLSRKIAEPPLSTCYLTLSNVSYAYGMYCPTRSKIIFGLSENDSVLLIKWNSP